MFRFLLVFLLVCGITEAQRPVSAADTLAIQSIGEVRPSPDGKIILFTLESVDPTANRSVVRLMRMAASGGEPEVVKGAPEGPSGIRWSPDGSRIACIAAGAVRVLDMQTAQRTRVCDYRRSNSFLSKAGDMLAWSPTGNEIAFAGTLDPQPQAQDPLVITRILYKGRTALSDNRRTHLYLVPAS